MSTAGVDVPGIILTTFDDNALVLEGLVAGAKVSTQGSVAGLTRGGDRKTVDAIYKSEGTTKSQVSSILNSLAMRDCTQAVLRAINLGML